MQVGDDDQLGASAPTARALFDGTVHYEIPPFQRPYVWTEEDQWQPLWSDVLRLLDAAADPTQTPRPREHFLGAIVLKRLGTSDVALARHSVVDGQQRITTLLLLLQAAREVIEEKGDPNDAESLSELVTNSAARYRNTETRLKLQPARIDREAFRSVMDDDVPRDPAMEESRVVQAHDFFKDAISGWVNDADETDRRSRLAALANTLQGQLRLVAIKLGKDDDDQLVFETLNDRGTPLLAADLIKNYIFQRCLDAGADVDSWNEKYWADFDDDWWRGEVAQGRLFRSRIDMFLQYWLTMRTLDEVPTDAVFRLFRMHAADHLRQVEEAEEFLRGLRRDADTFRSFTELAPDTPAGRFHSRVVEALELGVFIPVLLWLISENHQAPQDQVAVALQALESWAVRRTLLRLTMKDVNNLVVALLKELDRHQISQVGGATVDFLAQQTADARAWPADDDVRHSLPDTRVYGIKQQRLRTILAVTETKRRVERHEDVSLPTVLQIEHVMPQGWRDYWDDGSIARDALLAGQRDRRINTIGNLTLTTQKLNVALSNRPWTDEEARKVAPTGKDAGRGKRSLLSDFSLLVLNKEIVDRHPTAWTEDDIIRRSNELTEIVIEEWPHG
jgi:hypothetical protein